MKRTPIKRKTPLRRKRLGPSKRRRKANRSSADDWGVVEPWREFVRCQQCVACMERGFVPGCTPGRSQAAHVRAFNQGGTGIKPPDSLIIPLCMHHHGEQHAGRWPDKDAEVALWRRFIERHLGWVPEGRSAAEHKRACEELRVIGERRVSF